MTQLKSVSELSNRERRIIDEVRQQVSAVLSGWVELRFRAGQTPQQVYEILQQIQEIVSPGSTNPTPTPQPNPGGSSD